LITFLYFTFSVSWWRARLFSWCSNSSSWKGT